MDLGSSKRSPDERSDIRGLRNPAWRFAYAGYLLVENGFRQRVGWVERYPSLPAAALMGFADAQPILRFSAQADLRTALSTSVLPSDQIAPGTLWLEAITASNDVTIQLQSSSVMVRGGNSFIVWLPWPETWVRIL